MFGDIVDTSSLRSDRLLLLFALWTLWATRSVVHKSTGPAVRLAQVEGRDPVSAIAHGEHAVLAARAKGDRLAPQSLADAPGAVLEADEAVAVDLAHLIAGRVFDRRMDLGNDRELGR